MLHSFVYAYVKLIFIKHKLCANHKLEPWNKLATNNNNKNELKTPSLLILKCFGCLGPK